MNLSNDQKETIRSIYNSIFFKKFDKYKCTNDIILEGLDITEYQKHVYLKMKLGTFYEKLFAYLCNLSQPQKGFDLINKENNLYIELKTNYKTDNKNSKESKFNYFKTFKQYNQKADIYYMCLNDYRSINGVYERREFFTIVTGLKCWDIFCNIANINRNNLISFVKELVFNN